MELLTRLNQDRGITVLVVTHADDVAACAKRTVLIKDGLIESDLTRS
jgi:putative ABC transport system ATP-binding protein